MTDARAATAADILAFWRDVGRDGWYRRDAAFDAEVRHRFLATWQQAALIVPLICLGLSVAASAAASEIAKRVPVQPFEEFCRGL